jgi:ABC-type branched-subunit amino acid transport system substrate-binding protein
MIVSGHPPGTPAIANQTLELGFDPEVITGSSAPPQFLTSALNDAAIERFVHIHNSNPYEQAFTDVGSGFAGEYDTQFNTHTAYGYATGELIAAGLDEAGEADPTALADAVRTLSLDTLFAQPIQYNQYGELDETVVLFSRVLGETPSYDPDGSYSFEELNRSDSVPARVP